MADDELSKKDGSRFDPRLKDFLEIVPALVREYLAQSQEPAQEKAKVAHRDNLSSSSSGAQVERRPRVSDEKQMLTVTEVAAALGIKEATVRAWVSKRKITHVKLGPTGPDSSEGDQDIDRTSDHSVALNWFRRLKWAYEFRKSHSMD